MSKKSWVLQKSKFCWKRFGKKALTYEKRARKMLLKLAPACVDDVPVEDIELVVTETIDDSFENLFVNVVSRCVHQNTLERKVLFDVVKFLSE